jgi:Big-like domain-containing protein
MSSRKTNYSRLALLTATTVVVAACGGKDDYPVPMPPAANTAPAVAAITDKVAFQDTVVGPIEFAINDRESDASLLTVVASADGAGVVPADGVTLAGSGQMRSITLQPLEAATGDVNVTITVTDPQGAASSRSFRVTVNARNASIREVALATFAKGGSDDPTVVNGITFVQDADDPAIFAPLMGTGEE